MFYELDKDTEQKIKEHYQKGQGSIQDIARVYRVSVDQVLHLIGQDELMTVQAIGDQVDADEAGPGAVMNYQGKQFKVDYTVD